jgi:hypothetical protein
MLYREIIAVCSQIYTKHTNTLCGQNVELLNVKLVVHIVTNELQRVSTCCSAFDVAVCHGRSLFTLSIPSRSDQSQYSQFELLQLSSDFHCPSISFRKLATEDLAVGHPWGQIFFNK